MSQIQGTTSRYIVRIVQGSVADIYHQFMDSKQKWHAAFSKHLKSLDLQKPVIWAGDFNCIHTKKGSNNLQAISARHRLNIIYRCGQQSSHLLGSHEWLVPNWARGIWYHPQSDRWRPGKIGGRLAAFAPWCPRVYVSFWTCACFSNVNTVSFIGTSVRNLGRGDWTRL